MIYFDIKGKNESIFYSAAKNKSIECYFFDKKEKKIKKGIVGKYCPTTMIYTVYEVDEKTGEWSWLKSKHHLLDKYFQVYTRTKEAYKCLKYQENWWKKHKKGKENL